MTFLAVGAGDRHFLLVMQDMGGVAGADDGRQAQFAADDGGMGGAPAMVGDDGRGALHDRHPVGVGGRGHKDRAVDELVDVLDALDQADAAVATAPPTGQAGQQGPCRSS
jgi:hypothetical protein